MQHHLQALQSAAEKCLGGHPQVSIVVDNAAATALDQRAATTRATPPAGTAERLNPCYTFDTFVIGSSNQFAQAASQAVAELDQRAATTRATPPAGTAERLNPCYTFDTFVIGSSNQFAQAASQAVAE